MLSELMIKNFAIIDDIAISFGKGLSVLTGETGAGKSIILEAVNLLLGSRASSDMVRSGCDQAELEAVFDIDPNSVSATILKEQGCDPEEGLLIRRQIHVSGKSQVFINAKRSTLDLLKQVTRDLAGISSQHAHQGLLKTENHLKLLDEHAATLALRNDIKKIFDALMPLKQKVRQMTRSLEESRKEQDFIQFQIQEIQDAAIVENEDETLLQKRKILGNAAQIFEALNLGIHEINDREGSVSERLSTIANRIEQFADADERFLSISQRLSSTLFELQDISSDIRDLADGIDLDPSTLDMIDQRLDLIARIKRKYGPDLEDVFKTLDRLVRQTEDTVELENDIEASELKIQTLTREIREKSRDLSAKRQAYAEKLSSLAKQELAGLEMEQAEFKVDFSSLPVSREDDIKTSDGSRIGPDGQDAVQFLLSPNPGESLKPLSKIASGGELSRIVLALKAVLSSTQSLETLIFDEVDSGIGGRTSEKVGKKLKSLSQKHQIICITHLAQIAKYGTSQFLISKTVENQRTFTRIVPLTDDASRIQEIARMIGGNEITKATLDHAKEMLTQAAS